MRIYNEEITIHAKNTRETFDLTPRIKEAVEKSGFRDGLAIVSSLHANAGLVVNENEPGLLEDLDAWLSQIAPVRDDYKHKGRFESNAAIHLQAMLLGRQAIVAFTDAKLELGPWQSVLYIELDGLRPKRIQVKVLGAAD